MIKTLYIRDRDDENEDTTPLNFVIKFLMDYHPEHLAGRWKLEWAEMSGLDTPHFRIKGKEPQTVEYFDQSEFPHLIGQRLYLGHGMFDNPNQTIVFGAFDNAFFISGDSLLLEEIRKSSETLEFVWREGATDRSDFLRYGFKD